MGTVPDAWEDEWSAVADVYPQEEETTQKRVSTKTTKAQKRAQQAEFNRQFWAEAEGPAQPNYFLESRNVVPLRQEFKPAPILLSRKGPILQQKPKPASPQPPTDSLNNLSIASRANKNAGPADSSDEDEEETEEARKKAYEERQAQAAREREEKQRKYEERRLELFGPPVQTTNNNNNNTGSNNEPPYGPGLKSPNKSGTSSPASNTPPHSRSSTPNSRGRRGRGGRGASGPGIVHQHQIQPKIYQQQHQQPTQYSLYQHQQQLKELYDPQYSPKPESLLQRQSVHQAQPPDVQPVRAPKGPDGSGRGGFGFVGRGGKPTDSATTISPG